MAEKDYTKWELATKIGEARALVSQMSASAHVSHSSSCPVEMDMDYYGPCRCGATTKNNASYGIKERLMKVLTL